MTTVTPNEDTDVTSETLVLVEITPADTTVGDLHALSNDGVVNGVVGVIPLTLFDPSTRSSRQVFLAAEPHMLVGLSEAIVVAALLLESRQAEDEGCVF